MEEAKQNKAIPPASNKQVRIKMRKNRTDNSVVVNANGEALVDKATADRLIKDGYADLVVEKGV